MKAIFFIGILLCFIIEVRPQAATASAAGFTVGSTDSAAATNYPLAFFLNSDGTTAKYLFASPTDTAPKVAAGGAAASAPAGTSAANVLLAKYKDATGILSSQSFTLTQQTSGTGTAVGMVININVGNTVSISVTSTGGTAGTLQTSAAGVVATSTNCGDWFFACGGTGLLTFNLYVGTTASSACTVTVAQVPAVYGALVYATSQASAVTSASATLLAAIKAGAGSSASTAAAGTGNYWCGTSTWGSNTFNYFVQQVTSASATTTAATSLNTAIGAKTSFTTNAVTLLGGFAVPLTQTNSGGSTNTLATLPAYKPYAYTLSALTDTNSPLTLSGAPLAQASTLYILGSGQTLTGQFAAGLPLTSTIGFQNPDATAAGTGILTINVGSQVSLAVTACVTSTAATSACTPGGSLATAQSSSLSAGASCGQYYLDCATGSLQLGFNAPASTANNFQYCVYSITQVPAVFGGLAYATAPPTSAYTSLQNALNTQSGVTGGSARICGTTTSSGSTVLLFVQQLAAAASTSDVTTAQSKLATAIKAKTAFSGSSRLLEADTRSLQTSYTLLNGYANPLNTAAAAGFTAPSAGATASLAANASSQTRFMAFAAILISGASILMGLTL